MRVPKRYFQWIDGELAGKVETLSANGISELDGQYFYNFDSGEICNEAYIAPMTNTAKDLFEKVMVEVSDPGCLWTREVIESRVHVDDDTKEESFIPPIEDIVQADGSKSCGINSKLGQFRMNPPVGQKIKYKELPDHEMYGEKSGAAALPAAVQQPAVSEQQAEVLPAAQPMPVLPAETIPAVIQAPAPQEASNADPVSILVGKCKKNETEMNVTITLDLPARSMYQFAEENFEDGGDKFIDSVMSGINPSKVMDFLKDALKAAYSASDHE